MLRIVKGNLLDANENVIAHQVNCMGAMGSGVAHDIREKWPEVYKIYRDLVKTHEHGLLMGSVLYIRVSKNQWIANIFGQLDYGYSNKTYTDYDMLRHGLYDLKGLAEERDWSIAMPYRIGCGRGGGDWDGMVFPMLLNIFAENQRMNVTLYQL